MRGNAYRMLGPRRIAPRLLAVVLFLITIISFRVPRIAWGAETSEEFGVIFGSVSTGLDVVRGLRIKAKHTVHRSTYVVFTRNGNYRIPDLPPGTYEVQVVQKGFEAVQKKVILKPGESEEVDLSATKKEEEAKPENVELVDYDTLYPPGPGRDALERNCMGCHGRTTFQKFRLNETAWRLRLEYMTSANSPFAIQGIPPLPNFSVHSPEADLIVKYLTHNFGPDSPARNLKLDMLRVEENEVADALFVEYDLPEYYNGVRRTFWDVMSIGGGVHDPGIAPDGGIWFTDMGANSIIRLDPQELDFNKRIREYQVPDEKARAGGLTIDNRGHIYWGGFAHGYLGELEPKSGEMMTYPIPAAGTMHTLAADSIGNIWYNLSTGSRIGKLDAKSRTILQWDLPTVDANPYGLIVDQDDKVWTVARAKHEIIKFDPVTENFTRYPTPGPSGPRRLGVDSKGKIWFSEFFGGKVGMLDPETETMTEYQLPLHYTEPYEAWADNEDNIWVTDNTYHAIIKFDQKIKKFTYYPLPQPAVQPATVPKVVVDKDGTIWFGTRGRIENNQIVAFKPKGNATRRTM